MSPLERAVQMLSRWAPTLGTGAIAIVLQVLNLHVAATAAGFAALLFAAVALIDTCEPRS